LCRYYDPGEKQNYSQPLLGQRESPTLSSVAARIREITQTIFCCYYYTVKTNNFLPVLGYGGISKQPSAVAGVQGETNTIFRRYLDTRKNPNYLLLLLGFMVESKLRVTCSVGRAIAQAVSRWLPTAAARVRARVWSSGICG
jgi:hypothetical protein